MELDPGGEMRDWRSGPYVGAGGCLFGGRYVPVCAHPALTWWRPGDKAEGERKEPDRQQGLENGKKEQMK